MTSSWSFIRQPVSFMFGFKSSSACPISKPHISHHCSCVQYQFMLFPALTIPPRSHCTTFLDAGDMDATASAPVLPFCSLPHRLNSLHLNCHLNCTFQLHKQTNRLKRILMIKLTRCTNFSNSILILLASSQHNLYDICLLLCIQY